MTVIFKKDHSRAKPIVEAAQLTAGTTYRNDALHYTASICAPGGPPYVYFQLSMTEADMLHLTSQCSQLLNSKRGAHDLTELADRIDRLETERNLVENSFGNGPFQDGILLARLNELDREIARARASMEGNRG